MPKPLSAVPPRWTQSSRPASPRASMMRMPRLGTESIPFYFPSTLSIVSRSTPADFCSAAFSFGHISISMC